MTTSFHVRGRRLGNEEGVTLIETSIACGILIVTLAGLMSLAAVATVQTENQGHLTPRTTEYAQDKLEQLLALAYGNSTSNTVVFPATITGGTGLAIGGGTNTAAPVDGYVDWLGGDGSLLGGGTTPPASWFYQRGWQITAPSAGIKQVAVTATVRSSLGNFMLPRSTVVTLKSSQF